MDHESRAPGADFRKPPETGVMDALPPAAPAPPSAWYRPGRRRWLLVVAAQLAVAAGVWWSWPRAVDWDPILADNNHGIGLMDDSRYTEAVAAFEKVVGRAPDWLPGRINLGIALLFTANAGDQERARQLFESVLRKEPDNPHAHYCLAILSQSREDPQEAIEHLEAVLRKDPNDAASWCWLAQLSEGKRQAECYRRALDLDPALTPALIGMAGVLQQQGRHPEAKALLEQFNALQSSGKGNSLSVRYGAMGRYGELIGRRPGARPTPLGPLPLFQPHTPTVVLAPGARWATAGDFGADPSGQVRARVRARFGATLVILDFNGDGKPDLFLAGAVVEKGQVRDLLLRNDGEGKFTDVTAAAVLARPHPTLGCCVADFDNDGKADLLLTGAGSQRLFRNKGDGSFEDISAKAGLDKFTAVCLGAGAIDLDQDADLDLLIAEYAASPEEALEVLDGKKAVGGSLAVFLNIAEAEATDPGRPPPPLTGKFARVTKLAALHGTGPMVGLAAADLDGDGDTDLVALADGVPPALVLNDRLLRFRRQPLPPGVMPASGPNGALILDADNDGRSDLLLLPAGLPPQLLLSRGTPGEKDAGRWFEAGSCDSPPLLHAVAVDMDLDGRTDVVGLSKDRLPVLLHNEGGRLVLAREAFGQDGDWPGDLVAVTTCDVNGDDLPDLLVWSETKGVLVCENRGNGNQSLPLLLVGRNAFSNFGNRLRSNADGIASQVEVQAGDLWVRQEIATESAGLGQSRKPLIVGLGRHAKVDLVRVHWPDGVRQAQMDLIAGLPTRIVQDDRRPVSCPVLFSWDGTRFVFVTDFLGAGSVGELGPDRTCRPPRPEESVKIEPAQLIPRDGHFVLKIAEPMDEVTYLDRLQLAVIDHPAGVRVYPDERFSTGAPPSQELIAFDREIHPVAARDHRGRDVTEALRRWDRVTVDGFAQRAWVGFAEEHSVELDFADRLAGFGAKDKLYLCLAGWTDYATPASIWAAHQAGVEMRPPVLERQGPEGRWQSLGEAGFLAGLPRMMLLDVTGKLTGPRCRLRLRTNLHVFWDQVFVAAGCRVAQPTTLEVASATLEPCGVMQEYSPDGRQPTLYAHDRCACVPLSPPVGKRTRFGDVTELLRDKDDRFVVFGPGDGLTVRFDASKLPPLPAGWQRSFVLRTWGYCKDSSPFTALGETIEPLPFAAMSNYPPAAGEQYPQDALHADYLRRYQTR